MKIFICITILFSTIFIACSKHSGDYIDNKPTASIIVTKPQAGTLFSLNDTVHVQGAAIAATTIHGYDFIVRKANDTTKLYFLHVHDHNDTIQINQSWKATVSNVNLETELDFYLDHEGNTASKKIGFSVR
jgi:hypothetical protein